MGAKHNFIKKMAAAAVNASLTTLLYIRGDAACPPSDHLLVPYIHGNETAQKPRCVQLLPVCAGCEPVERHPVPSEGTPGFFDLFTTYDRGTSRYALGAKEVGAKHNFVKKMAAATANAG